MHGHHQAVAEAVAEAFDSACDPNQFPEMVGHGLVPWQPFKLYDSASGLQHLVNAGQGATRASHADVSPEHEDILRINTGEYDPVDGRTLQERAWQSVNCHQTQGMGFIPSPGDFYYQFHLRKTLVPVSSHDTHIFAGFDPTLTGIADLANGAPPLVKSVLSVSDQTGGLRSTLEVVKQRVGEAIGQYQPDDPLPSARPLLEGLSLLQDLEHRLCQPGIVPDPGSVAGRVPDDAMPVHLVSSIASILGRKVKEFEEAIARCLGLRLQCLCTRRKLTPGESLWLSARLWNHRSVTIDKVHFHIGAPDNWDVIAEEGFEHHDAPENPVARYEVFAGDEADLSCPYWLEKPRQGDVYVFPREDLARQPLSPSPLEAECRLSMGEHQITIRGPVLHRKSFPGGYRELPPVVVPPISLHPESSQRFLLSTQSEQQLELRVLARCNDDEWPAEGHLKLQVPEGWHCSPSTMNVHLAQGGGAQTCTFQVRLPPSTPEGHYRLDYSIRCRNRDYGVVLTPVRRTAPGLPATEDESTCTNEEFLLSPACVTAHVVDARYPVDRNYACVEGAKEGLIDTLTSLGLCFERLSDYDIVHGDLGRFDAIVVGPNAYILRHSLRENAFRLLEYVKAGGTLIVQYQRYEYEQAGLAPYPFEYSRPHDRVTNERAPVKILRPESRLFQLPNAIGFHDFEGWVHDRGLYFLDKWDDRYVTYLSCSDPGEEPKEGGLLGCQFGRGNFVYIGYSLFRQLPAGVPGAFRLFLNMLALCQEEGPP
jgi:hypothetical protein